MQRQFEMAMLKTLALFCVYLLSERLTHFRNQHKKPKIVYYFIKVFLIQHCKYNI